MPPTLDQKISNATHIPDPPKPGKSIWLDHFEGYRGCKSKPRVKFKFVLRSDMLAVQLIRMKETHPYATKVLMPHIHREEYRQIAPAGLIRIGPAIRYIDAYINANPPT
jgi:hypothetical protein